MKLNSCFGRAGVELEVGDKIDSQLALDALEVGDRISVVIGGKETGPVLMSCSMGDLLRRVLKRQFNRRTSVVTLLERDADSCFSDMVTDGPWRGKVRGANDDATVKVMGTLPDKVRQKESKYYAWRNLPCSLNADEIVVYAVDVDEARKKALEIVATGTWTPGVGDYINRIRPNSWWGTRK